VMYLSDVCSITVSLREDFYAELTTLAAGMELVPHPDGEIGLLCPDELHKLIFKYAPTAAVSMRKIIDKLAADREEKP